MIPVFKEHQFSAIYLITCLVNDKIYVGSAVDFYRRYMVYKHSHAKEQRPIARAMQKYGFDKFEFSILERVNDLERLIEREQYHLDVLKPFGKNGYNLEQVAGSSLGRKHSKETVEKIKRLHDDEDYHRKNNQILVLARKNNGIIPILINLKIFFMPIFT
jgi:group I intron endonuclease